MEFIKASEYEPEAARIEYHQRRKAKRQQHYQEYLRSPAWKEIRELVLERDGYACIRCSSEINLNVHHVFYSWPYGSEINKLQSMITLCRGCHLYLHGL